MVGCHIAHKQCDNQDNNNGGVKSALDEGIYIIGRLYSWARFDLLFFFFLTESGKWRCPTCVASGHDSNPIPESTPSHKSRSRRVSAGKSS
jgi:hypothetical protein